MNAGLSADQRPLIDVCASSDLLSGGRGVRFEVDVGGRNAPAFVVRYGGRAFAYLNRCAHVATELDWMPGLFFDFDAEFLLCATHGALYDPASGECRGGACAGFGGLRALTVVERDGRVLWQPDGYAEPLRGGTSSNVGETPRDSFGPVDPSG